MANPIKGEVEIPYGNAGGGFTIVYTVDALCHLEAELNMKVSEIAEAMEAGMFLTQLRACFWAGLRTHHPGVTLLAAGDLLPELGPGLVGQKIGEAFSYAYHGRRGAAKAPARPRKPPTRTAAAGTGKTSTATGVS